MRTWTDPAIMAAEEDLHQARQVVSRAQTRLAHFEENRRRQVEAETVIRYKGGEPYLRPRIPSPEDQFDEQKAGWRVVHFWASDEEIAKAKTELAEVETRLEAATENFNEAKANSEPLDDGKQQALARKLGGYQAIRPIKLAGIKYWPGQPVPAQALSDLPWTKGGPMVGWSKPDPKKGVDDGHRQDRYKGCGRSACSRQRGAEEEPQPDPRTSPSRGLEAVPRTRRCLASRQRTKGLRNGHSGIEG